MNFSEQLASKAVPSRRRVVSDPDCKGLYLDIRLTGKSWRYRFTDAHGKPGALTVGDASRMGLEAARQKVAMLAIRRASKDLPPGSTPSYSHFISSRYLPFAFSTKKSAEWEEIMIRCHLIPAFGSVRLDQISTASIRQFAQAKRADGYAPGTVNRMLSILKVTLAVALEWEIAGVEANPAKAVKLLKDPPRIDRFLSRPEAERLMAEVRSSASSMLRYIVPFLLSTGARKREALDAKWQDVNFDQQLWTIPVTKAGKPRYVPLSPQAVSTLNELRAAETFLESSRWLFPSPETGRPYRTIFHSWDRCRTAAGLKDVRIHDLRHSFASAMINEGMAIYDVKEALRHSNIATTQRYAHLSRERLRDAVNAAGAHYSSAVTPDERGRIPSACNKIVAEVPIVWRTEVREGNTDNA